jgi:phage shock protein A
MGLFRRVSDIITANLNEMVDGMEKPETMLKQAVREMEAALDGAMDGAARAIAHERVLRRQLAENEKLAAFWARKAVDCVARDDDDAARGALVRKTEQLQLIAALTDQLTEAETTSARLRNQIAAMRVRISEARRKLADVLARRQAAEARRTIARGTRRRRAHEAAFGRFDHLVHEIERGEAEADALLELAGCTYASSFDDRDGASELDSQIEAELRALKEQPQEQRGE